MQDSIISKLISYLLKNWQTFKGFWAAAILLFLSAISLGSLGLSFNFSAIFVSLSLILWSGIWIYSSGRIILPSNKKTVILCFDVDWDGIKNYRKVINKIINSIAEVGLDKKIRIKTISHDLISTKKKAHKYRGSRKVDLIIWGKTDYGYRNNEKVLIFELQHTLYISKSLSEKLNLFLTDVSLILAKKDWEIKEINELEEYKIVANNFLETILFIIGIYFYDEGQLNDSIKIFEFLLPVLTQKEKVKKIVEFQIQSGRVRTLLVEQYFLYGRILHDNGKIPEALEYLKKIPEKVPNPIPLYIMLARVSYLNGDEKNANYYTEKIRKINKRHPSVCLNYAFFGIKQKNYDRVKFWYDEFIKQKVIVDIDIMSVVTFLDEEYSKCPTEHAYLYALGIVNGFLDLLKRKRDLQRFVRLTKNRSEYLVLQNRAKELIKS